jgi:hypothetical protein
MKKENCTYGRVAFLSSTEMGVGGKGREGGNRGKAENSPTRHGGGLYLLFWDKFARNVVSRNDQAL